MSDMIFENILESHKSIILRFCFIYASNSEDQKDLFQEIAFNIWKSLHSFKNESALSTWIYKLALRVALNYSKREKRRKKVNESFIQFENRPDVEDDLEKKELSLQLKYCISQLQEIDKLLVILYLEEISYKEISEIMGISENLVAVKMKRVKIKLFKCLNK